MGRPLGLAALHAMSALLSTPAALDTEIAEEFGIAQSYVTRLRRRLYGAVARTPGPDRASERAVARMLLLADPARPTREVVRLAKLSYPAVASLRSALGIANPLAQGQPHPLTETGRRVVEMVRAGVPDCEIARDLGLSPDTVMYHRRRWAPDAPARR